jgi:hypothetical protein
VDSKSIFYLMLGNGNKTIDLKLGNLFSETWDQYIESLRREHIWISNLEDELVWQLSPFGDYSPKMGYSQLIIELQQQEPTWWWKGIWKVKCPLKEKIFMWCLIKKRVPMWDRMKKPKVEGPGWCALCKNEKYSNNYLFINCAFYCQCWKECTKILELDCRWEWDLFKESWKS